MHYTCEQNKILNLKINCEEKKETLLVVLYIICKKDVLSPDVLSLRTFCPAGRFVSTDVLSLQTFCLYGGFVPTDVLSHGRYVSGCFVSGCFVPTDVLSPDVLSGH